MLRRAPAPPFTWILALALAAGCAQSRTSRPTPGAGRLGERFELVAPDLAGREHDIGAEQGKVRVVEFWASWCEPCRDAMPHLAELVADLGARGLSVYAVSFDEDRDQVSAFLERMAGAPPVLWDKGGDRWSARYEVTRLPTTVLVDRKGVVRAVQAGWTPAKARETRREVERLLGEAP
jgi:thiol-disulfide isomerase/thioredoxin